MRVRGAYRARRILRRLSNRLTPGGLVLLYHRVTRLGTDPQLLAVTPQHFAEHLEVLRRHARVVPLADMAAAARRGDTPRRSVAITFDDGYADNLQEAKPLLDRYDLPATVFVTTGPWATGPTATAREFFWDELDRLLLQPGKAPEALRVPVGADTYRADLRDDARYDEGAWRRHRGWNLACPTDPTARQKVYRELCPLLEPLDDEARQVALSAVRAWAGAAPSGRVTHRTMTAAEVTSLAAGGRIEVGAHTVTHPVLSTLPPDRQEAEVRKGKADLEQLLGRTVKGFSYPFGGRPHYGRETVSAVKGAGFEYACTTSPGLVRPGGGSYEMPRELVRDWDGDVFLQQLRGWLE
jgi:peptidoglycan/xylan/chitin deacetylase (PgdA/CDA1 family)